MEKTVYILGAGFSKDLGAPLQNEILKEIFNTRDENNFSNAFIRYRKELKDFMVNDLCFDETRLLSIKDEDIFPPLEDIFTPIDRCIIDNSSFRNRSKSELIELRRHLNTLLIMMFKQKLENVNNNYANRFANYLIRQKINYNIEEDPISIISLNWDIFIDNALNYAINQHGVVDYCLYASPMDPDDVIKNGLQARGEGRYNFKLLKLHGSMNWLQCQRCHRIFIKFGEKIAIDESQSCRFCNENFTEESNNKDGAILASQLIMPTFLKDLSNVQLKLIWQNAGIELSEASKIVFMGYSLPAADFELRQLLSRFVRHNADIEVVLIDKDKPVSNEVDSPTKRYRNFFGRRSMKFDYGGVENYINQKLTNSNN